MVRSATVVAASVLAAAAVAWATDVPRRDAVQLVALSCGVALAVHLLGRFAIRFAQRRVGIGAAAAVLALLPLASVVAGAVVAALAMFVSTHDLSVLLVVITGAATTAVLGALALAGEITAARRTADAAADRERRIEHSRRELVAWISHDLRTPLAAIRAMVEALEDGVVSDAETVTRYHRQVGDESERLAHLIDDLFELSRIEADALQLTFERVSVSDVVSDAVAATRVLAAAKGIDVDGRIVAEVPLVEASVPELTRVVRNLLDNAIRHTPAGGAVEVEVLGDRDAVVVSVRDQCGGIPSADIDRVFDAAYRGDDARSSAGGGLGLAIARGFVEAHRGEIGVHNDGGGCRFTVRLPVA